MTGLRGNSIAYDYDFFVLFVGLIGWVPRFRRGGIGPIMDAGASAVLPCVKKGDQHCKYDLPQGGELPTHHARWVIIAGDCSPPGGCPQREEAISKGSRKLLRRHGLGPPRYEPLDRVSLYFEFPQATLHPFSRIRGLRSAGDRWPKYREAALDFDWVPPMGDICSSERLKEYLDGAQVVHPKCLDGGAGTPRRVAALAQLTSGSLMTAMLTEVGGRAPIFTAHPTKAQHHALKWQTDRTLTEYVLWHVEVSDPDETGVVVKKAPLDGGVSEKVTLKPKPFLDDQKPMIVLRIENRPDAHSLGHPHGVGAGSAIDHFAAFYELSDRSTDRQYRAVPHVGARNVPSFGPLILPESAFDERRKALGCLAAPVRLLHNLKVRALERKLIEILGGGAGRPLCPQAQFNPVELP